MTKNTLRLPYLLTLTALALLAVPAPAGNEALEVRPRAARQGDPLFLRLSLPGAEDARVSWLNGTYPLYQDGSAWSGAVPIRPETKVGGHTVVVRFTRDGRPQSVRRVVQVHRVDYPVQHLRMARSTAKLYNYPGVEKENRIIGTAIRAKSDEQLWSGDWLLPSKGRISTKFGERRLRNGRYVGRHRGLDIAAKQGTPVLASAAGKVVLAGSYRKHGKTVVLDHGQGITSLYIHMSAIHVRKGQLVKRGQRVGSVGSTGVSTGPHLHWSIYVHGTPLEPLRFCRLGRVMAGLSGKTEGDLASVP